MPKGALQRVAQAEAAAMGKGKPRTDGLAEKTDGVAVDDNKGARASLVSVVVWEGVGRLVLVVTRGRIFVDSLSLLG